MKLKPSRLMLTTLVLCLAMVLVASVGYAMVEIDNVQLPTEIGEKTTHRYHSIEKLSEQVYCITDDLFRPYGGSIGYNPSSMYLVKGSEKDLLIDCGNKGMSGTVVEGTPNQEEYARGFQEILAVLCDKPMEVAITHWHPDHIGLLYLFTEETVYFPEGEKSSGEDYGLEYGDNYVFINDGYVIDLGDVQLTAVMVRGHSPSGLCYLDLNNKILAVGDAVGSLFIYLYGENAFEYYEQDVARLYDMVKDTDGILYCTGHSWQQNPVNTKRESAYVPTNDYPMTNAYLSDMLTLLAQMKDGTAKMYDFIVDDKVQGVCYVYDHAMICTNEAFATTGE